MRALRAQHGHEGVERGVGPRDGGVRAGDGMAMARLAGHHGPVMGRHGLDLDGRVAPHLDALLPDVGLPPLAAELVAARIARIEALDVEVLVVRHAVRHAPRHARGVAEVRQAGHAREAQPDGVPVGAGEMVLVVHARHVEGPMRIPRDEWLAGSRAAATERPAIAALRRPGHERHRRDVALHLREPVEARPAVLGRRRHDQERMRLGLAGEVGGLVGPEIAEQLGAPQLGLPRAHVEVTHLEDGHAVPRLPGIGARAHDLELDAPALRAVDEGVDAGGKRLEHGARVGRRMLPVEASARLEAEAAEQPVALHARRAHPLGPAPVGAPPVVFHLEQPVLGVHPALAEERVVRRGGADVRNALGVAVDLDGRGDAGDVGVHGRYYTAGRRRQTGGIAMGSNPRARVGLLAGVRELER